MISAPFYIDVEDAGLQLNGLYHSTHLGSDLKIIIPREYSSAGYGEIQTEFTSEARLTAALALYDEEMRAAYQEIILGGDLPGAFELLSPLDQENIMQIIEETYRANNAKSASFQPLPLCFDHPQVVQGQFPLHRIEQK
ncbi:MAG: hypothetical protein ACTSXQ_03925 [Alphaproteobacteria bacterium]